MGVARGLQTCVMALFRRARGGRSQLGELSSWAESRAGIEAFIEPPTSLNPTTLLLVADDGEFVRRPVASPQVAAKFAQGLRIPLYDVNRVGYPARMREYAQRKAGRRQADNPFRTTRPPRSSADAPAPPAATRRFSPAAVNVLALHAGVVPPESPTVDDLRRLLRVARSRVHPDRSEGERAAWDAVDAAARELGLS